MMTANRQALLYYTGDSSLLLAVHEAGHAVAHLLLGHHVLRAKFGIDASCGHILTGNTQFTGMNVSALPNMVAAAAGEAAVKHMLDRQYHPNASTIAWATAEHDREYIAGLGINTTLPLGIETDLAARIVADHWDAIDRVAWALRKCDDGRLDQYAITAAANLGNTEISWDTLADMANAAMPADAGLEAYLDGPGWQQEHDRVEFLRRLRTHNILYTPEPATRRQLNAEIFDRGLPEILAALDAAERASKAGETR